MFESLIKFVKSRSLTPLTDRDVELIKNTFIHKKLRKRQYYLQQGEVCKCLAFIVKGATRQYSVDDKGVEHIIHLAIENWWVGDRESHITSVPSLYNIDAWEDTDLLEVSRADVLNQLHLIPAINEMERSLDENYAIATQKRLNAHLSCSAEKRYADLVNTYPQFLQRFPLHVIASYLGITKETLSRIRNNTVAK